MGVLLCCVVGKEDDPGKEDLVDCKVDEDKVEMRVDEAKVDGVDGGKVDIRVSKEVRGVVAILGVVDNLVVGTGVVKIVVTGAGVEVKRVVSRVV